MLGSRSDVDLEECERVAVRVAREAGQIINDTCGKVTCVESKQSFADLVTETDQNVEKFVFAELKKSFPKHRFIGEESVAAEQHNKVEFTDEPTWIVDPVDGTTNFVHTLPFVAVCIGLSLDRKPAMGVVYCPALNQMFTARQGNGAYCNGERLSVRCVPSLRESLICAEMGSDRSDEKRVSVMKNLESIAWQCHGIRSLGSAAMNICSVAQGQTQAFYEFGLHCWDMCAPAAILAEAGGYVCDTEGGPLNLIGRRIIAACDAKIARELSAAMPSQLELPSD